MAIVRSTHWLTTEVFELVVSREGLEYRAGDCTLLIRDDGVDSRPYSFSSHPSQSELRFLIRSPATVPSEGQFSTWLASRRPGDLVGLGTPFGGFAPGQSESEVWLATGTGISPFVACLRGPSNFRPRLYFGVRSRAEALFSEFLESRCDVQWYFSREEPRRHIRVNESFPIGPGHQYYLCGNPRMIQSCSEQLATLGIEPARIHEESFFV